ncbi:UBX domain-containing protein 7 [Crotalus adamanteus]|uniref:UBX domain-containing protein 7 n=1 Tax=Crotalus adamanteus TaxID=8729 RepID=A0AAW1BH30_CROAD
MDIFVEPVTLPCHHTLCNACFQLTVEKASLCCPFCRRRVSSWARYNSRNNTLINLELWEKIKKHFPEECQRRIHGQDLENYLYIPQPIHCLSKPGELRQEYEAEITKVEAERRALEQEESKASEEYIQRLLAEEEEEQRLAEEREKKIAVQLLSDEVLARELSFNLNRSAEESIKNSPLPGPSPSDYCKTSKNKSSNSGDIKKYLSPKSCGFFSPKLLFGKLKEENIDSLSEECIRAETRFTLEDEEIRNDITILSSETTGEGKMIKDSPLESTGGKMAAPGGSAAASVLKGLIQQFTAITGASESAGKHMLEACNNNLEMAVTMFLDGGGIAEEPSTSSASVSNLRPHTEDEVRAPIPQKQEILVEPEPLFGAPKRRRPARSIFDGFRDFQTETIRQEQELRNGGAIDKKLTTLADLFRPPIDLMHKGSFETAKECGQMQNKWLMINIQNVQDFACQCLNRDVWSNDAVKNIIREHFIFWQVYHDSEEGQRYIQFYKLGDFPYVSILDPRTGQKLVEWHQLDVTSFLDQVTGFLGEHGQLDGHSTSPPQKRTRSESLIDASEDSQLEAAIRASLQETHFDSEQIKQESRSDEESESELFSGRMLEETGTKPEDLQKEPSVNGPKAQLMLRYPDGKREQISLPEQAKLLALIRHVQSKGYPNERFELLTNFPRRKLSHLDYNITLQEAGLCPQETVFVQERN